ncbi:MAG TPA: hypothetical protein VEV45_21065 [Streptosporangiaceae bacterium]|nr:hypothetical protein [Streptosporangiaceae bacterium]
MTTPQQPPPQQPPPQQLPVAAAAVLATAATVAAAAGVLAPLFIAEGIRRKVVEAALGVVMGMPPETTGFHGPATAHVARLNLMRRAQFLVASARRLQADVTAARSRDESLVRALADGVIRERRNYGQHLMANWARAQAAANVDSASMDYGRLLGWYTRRDSRTSPECLAANRRNFYADQMPPIGYPGAVHPHCRCLPGPPFPGAPLVGGEAFRARRPAYA